MRETNMTFRMPRRRCAVRAVLLCAFSLLVCPAAWCSESVSLTWDTATASGVVGYYLYCGPSSGNYTTRIDVGNNTTVNISGLTGGQTNYFVVTAYNQARMEGLPSNEAKFVVPISNPALAPVVTVISPSSGVVGGQVNLYGTNLSTVFNVQVTGINASFSILSGSQISVVVPPGSSSGPLTVVGSGGVSSHYLTVYSARSPANDNFANARVLTGSTATVLTNTAGATAEFGEPLHAGIPGGSSVWYRWTAPANGQWTLDATGSDFTELLGVYTGNSVSTLTSVASNVNMSGTLTNVLNFNATGGQTYQIAADGYAGAEGNLILRLMPSVPTNIVYATAFETADGFSPYLPLVGVAGWVSSGTANSGIKNNFFQGYGQQGYLGFGSIANPATTSVLYRPLAYTMDTNNRPAIQFSVKMQIADLLNLYSNTFAWSVRNAAGHEFFRVSFDDSTKLVSYSLDNGAGPVATGVSFDNLTGYNFLITMDFARKRWSANLNGTAVVTEQPITTVGAALTLGDIDAVETFKTSSSPGSDGVVFDNFQITSGPSLVPKILSGLQNLTAAGGGSALLGAVVIGSPPLSFQWYFNGAVIPNATNGSLSFQDLTSSQSGVYTLVVTNSYGSASSTATLTVPNVSPAAAFSATSALGQTGTMLTLNVVPNNNYRFQASTNLTTWVTLGSFFADCTNVLCYDPLATNYPQRFYRLVSP